MQANDGEGANHPLATRMAFLAFLSHNLTMSTIFGSFAVLLTAVETELGVGRDVSTLAIPPLIIGNAILAPLIGSIAGRVSLRLLAMLGSALGAAGFALLGVGHSVVLYLLAYTLFLGPAMSIAGVIVPATLVIRWFGANRGRALGIVHMPIALIGAPLLCAFLLRGHGLHIVYFALSGIMIVNLIAQAFVIDYPPSAADPSGEDAAVEQALQPAIAIGTILRQPSFWAMALAFAALGGGTILLNAHVVAMAKDWGIDPIRAASLLTIAAIAAICGTLLYGWLSDRLGGAKTLMIMCVVCLLLWSALLTRPSFAVLAVIVFLCGLHSSGSIPAFGTAITDSFGRGSYARAYGLGNTIGMPVTTLAVPVAAKIYVVTGAYTDAILLQMALYGVTALGVLLLAARSPRPAGNVAA